MLRVLVIIVCVALLVLIALAALRLARGAARGGPPTPDAPAGKDKPLPGGPPRRRP